MRFARTLRSVKLFGRCAPSFAGHSDISPNITAILKTFTWAVILPVEHLAAMMALADWRGAYGLSPNVVKTIFPVSGLFDLEPLRHSYLQPDLRLDDREIETQSPQRLVRRVHAPMLLSYGSEEPSEFSRQSDDFLSAWKRAGNRATCLPQIGRNHFTAIADFADKDSPFCCELFGLMGHTLRPQSAFGDRPAASVLIPTSHFGLSNR